MNCLHLFGLCRLGIHHSESCQRWFYRVSLVKSTVFFDSYLNILVFFIFYCFFFFFLIYGFLLLLYWGTHTTQTRDSHFSEKFLSLRNWHFAPQFVTACFVTPCVTATGKGIQPALLTILLLMKFQHFGQKRVP